MRALVPYAMFSLAVLTSYAAGQSNTPQIAAPGPNAAYLDTAGVSNGVAVHHAIPTAANTFRAVLQAPALALGASYSIPVAVYVVNR